MWKQLKEKAMDLARRLWWGARWGALFGCAFVAIAVAIYVLSGQSAFESHHTTFGQVALTYFFGGVIAGVVVGILRPLTRSKAGAALVGFMAAMPVAILMRFATDGFGPWQQSDTVEIIVLSLILGAPTGILYREIFSNDSASARDKRG
jgi:hypothetical protein